MKYEAVTKERLRKKLKHQCSPMRGKEGYVIGPTNDGRLAHVATCDTMAEAREIADRHNKPKVFEIYTKNPETKERGWDIKFVRSTRDLISSYPDFDCIITTNDAPCGVKIINFLGE